jgi:hypothetical protein
VLLITRHALLATCFIPVYCLAYSSTLKMEAISSETSVDFHRTTWRYIAEGRIFLSHFDKLFSLLLICITPGTRGLPCSTPSDRIFFTIHFTFILPSIPKSLQIVTFLHIIRQICSMHFCCMCIPYTVSELHGPYVGRMRS